MIGNWTIDRETFGLFVHGWRKRNRYSIREAREASRIGVAILSRAENKRTISAANFVAICLAIEANPFWFLVDPDTSKRVVEPPEVRGVERGTRDGDAKLFHGEHLVEQADGKGVSEGGG